MNHPSPYLAQKHPQIEYPSMRQTHHFHVEDSCIGCGLCTTKCAFDAIHLDRDRPECSTMVKYEQKLPSLGKYALKRAIKIKFGRK